MSNGSGDDSHSMGEAKCIGATEKAIKVLVSDTELWIPKSVVHDDSEVWKHGDEGKLVVKAWWAEKNGYAYGD